jgi:hypothetical protein
MFTTFLLSLALIFSSGGSPGGQKAHRHSKLADVQKELASDVEIVGIVFEIAPKKEQVVRSADRKFEAFTVNDEGDSTGYRIFFVEKATGIIYEVRGLPLPHRPFSDLVWNNNRTLVFDRWSQPHYGIHYAVDVITRKLVTASAFPD